jgi:hypothetical protein
MQSMIDSKLFSSDWIYENIFHLSVEEYEEMRELAVEDAKRTFRITQVENEGNDPNISGKSFGTPHDIASAYGKGRVYDRPGDVPTGYNEDEPVIGRPKEKASHIGTQEDLLGKDRIGKSAMKNDDQEGYGRDKTKPLAFESTKREFSKHYKTLEGLTDKKVNLFEDRAGKGGLLDESQIREDK